MSEITLETTADKYLISIDRTLMDKPTFRVFLSGFALSQWFVNFRGMKKAC